MVIKQDLGREKLRTSVKMIEYIYLIQKLFEFLDENLGCAEFVIQAGDLCESSSILL